MNARHVDQEAIAVKLAKFIKAHDFPTIGCFCYMNGVSRELLDDPRFADLVNRCHEKFYTGN